MTTDSYYQWLVSAALNERNKPEHFASLNKLFSLYKKQNPSEKINKFLIDLAKLTCYGKKERHLFREQEDKTI